MTKKRLHALNLVCIKLQELHFKWQVFVTNPIFQQFFSSTNFSSSKKDETNPSISHKGISNELKVLSAVISEIEKEMFIGDGTDLRLTNVHFPFTQILDWKGYRFLISAYNEQLTESNLRLTFCNHGRVVFEEDSEIHQVTKTQNFFFGSNLIFF